MVASALLCSYFAGFYEGEGHVSNDISNNNRMRLGIDQNDPTPLGSPLGWDSYEKGPKISSIFKIMHLLHV